MSCFDMYVYPCGHPDLTKWNDQEETAVLTCATKTSIDASAIFGRGHNPGLVENDFRSSPLSTTNKI